MFKFKTILIASTTLLLYSSIYSKSSTADPCQKEKKTYCQGMKNPKEMMDCLREDESRLSPACKERVDLIVKEFKSKIDLCQEDRSKFCKWVLPGGGRILKCLKEKEGELSLQCKDALADLYEITK